MLDWTVSGQNLLVNPHNAWCIQAGHWIAPKPYTVLQTADGIAPEPYCTVMLAAGWDAPEPYTLCMAHCD